MKLAIAPLLLSSVFASPDSKAAKLAKAKFPKVAKSGYGNMCMSMSMPPITQNPSGYYNGLDIEDSSEQLLQLTCSGGVCEIILLDSLFATCGGIFGGIGLARNIPQDSLNDFEISLYCKQSSDSVIDVNGEPSGTLDGSLAFLSDGGIHRKGPDFIYYKVSVAEVESNRIDWKATSLKPFSGAHEINGNYFGTDMADGTMQDLSIYCSEEDDLCDISLLDTSFTVCEEENGSRTFFGGVGLARGVPVESLKKFDIKVYCVKENELIVDPSLEPDAILPGDLSFIHTDVLRRGGPGITYWKVSNTGKSLEVNNYQQKLYGIDVRDGTLQEITIKCDDEDICDLSLIDASFSTCIENIPGDIFLGGIAIASRIPKDSLHDFEFKLFCRFPGEVVINLDKSVATILGGIEFLDDGIVRRKETGFVYFNYFQDQGLLTNGLYSTSKFSDGSNERLLITCDDEQCDLRLMNIIFTRCILPPNFLPYINGFGIARRVPKDSLDNFSIDIYCIGELGLTVDIDVDEPTYTIMGNSLVGKDEGITLRTSNDPEAIAIDSSLTYYKISSD